MEKKFIRVFIITFYVIFFEKKVQLMSHGMLGDSTGTYGGIADEFYKTHYMQVVENRSSHSTSVQNNSESKLLDSTDSLLERSTNEMFDKDYSGDVGVESNISSMILMESEMITTPIAANELLFTDKSATELHDVDYSGDLGVNSNISSRVLKEREITMTPVITNLQYFTDGKEIDADALSQDRATLRHSKNSEISTDLISTDFEFSGEMFVETFADIEQHQYILNTVASEMPGSRDSGEEHYNLEGVGTNLKLDLDTRSTKQLFLSKRFRAEETEVTTSKFTPSSNLLDLQNSTETVTKSEDAYVSNPVFNNSITDLFYNLYAYFFPPQKMENYTGVSNSYISVEADKNPNLGSGVTPTKFSSVGRTRTAMSGVWNNSVNVKVTKKGSNARKRRTTLTSNRRSATSAINQKRYGTSQVPFRILVHTAKLENFEASKVHSTTVSNFSKEMDYGRILLSQEEFMLNAASDNALQALLLQNSDNISQKTRGFSNVPGGRTATALKKTWASYSEYSRLAEKKSTAVFISTKRPAIETGYADYALQNRVEFLSNSTGNESSAELFQPYQKVLMICSAIFILLLGLTVITVIFIRHNPQMKNCCTRTMHSVEEPRHEESSIPLNEVVVRNMTDPPAMEPLENEEVYYSWVAPQNG